MAAAPLAGLGQPEQSGGVGSLKGPGALSQVAQQVRDVCPEVGGLLKLRTPSSSALHPPSPGSPSERWCTGISAVIPPLLPPSLVEAAPFPKSALWWYLQVLAEQPGG